MRRANEQTSKWISKTVSFRCTRDITSNTRKKRNKLFFDECIWNGSFLCHKHRFSSACDEFTEWRWKILNEWKAGMCFYPVIFLSSPSPSSSSLLTFFIRQFYSDSMGIQFQLNKSTLECVCIHVYTNFVWHLKYIHTPNIIIGSFL